VLQPILLGDVLEKQWDALHQPVAVDVVGTELAQIFRFGLEEPPDVPRHEPLRSEGPRAVAAARVEEPIAREIHFFSELPATEKVRRVVPHETEAVRVELSRKLHGDDVPGPHGQEAAVTCHVPGADEFQLLLPIDQIR